MIVLLPLLVAALTFGATAYAIERRSVDPARRVAAHVAPRRVARAPESGPAHARFERPLAASAAQLRKLPLWARLERLVELADVRMGAVKLFWATAAGLVVLAVLLWSAGLSLGSLVVAALLAVVAVRLWLGVRIDRRRRAFEEQLPELLASLGSALRAGHGFNQALQSVAADSPEPAAGELGRVLNEARLGRPLEEALADLARRIDSKDFDFVLDAIVVQRQVGGSLAGIFELVGDSVRQRQQAALKIRALTAMGRTSALVLVALPIVLALGMTALNHSYLSPLFDTGAGHFLLAMSACLTLVGVAWLRRIVSYKG